MSLTRLVITLLIFFGLLYYFQGPLKALPQEFASLHSPYVQTFKNTFNGILTATSSSVISGTENYIPGMAGSQTGTSSGNGTSPNTTPTTISEGGTNGKTSSGSGNTSSTSNDPSSQSPETQLLPVTSNEGYGVLSSSGIIADTNVERQKVGLHALQLNQDLTNSAEAKLQDMFQNQYFAHVSPSGENVANVVTREGYDYIVVGENLALGLFPSDASVVAAWMASPGHKRNILDSRYQDIGVAVGQGVYQGRQQWLIVQHFGKPLSACPAPNGNLKATITTETSDLSTLEQNITTAKQAVDQATAGSDDYSAKVDAYNALVTKYNSEKDSLQQNLTVYNASVKAFNDCIGAGN